MPVPYADFSDPQSLNLYGFVGGNPASKTDLDGHGCEGPALSCPIFSRLSGVDDALKSAGERIEKAVDQAAATLADFANFAVHEYQPHAGALPPPGACSCPESNQQGKQNNNNSQSTNQSESSGQDKKIPNPNGKNGDAAHQETIGKVEKDMQNRGLTTQREYKIKTSGGEKSSRYVDVVGKDAEGNVVEMHQVGRQTQAGNPVARETRALNDIENATGTRPQFHPSNKPKE